MLYTELDSIVRRHPNHTLPPVSLHGQLLWREFFYFSAATTPQFDQMVVRSAAHIFLASTFASRLTCPLLMLVVQGNPRCRQIDWDIDADLLQAWKNAQTGYPFVDAIMTQLRTEGDETSSVLTSRA
jgi:cryptochrome